MSDTCKPSREPLIVNAMACCENGLERLETETSSLLAKINPVLSTAEPIQTSDVAKCGNPCKLAGEITSITDRINALRERVADSLNRVEV